MLFLLGYAAGIASAALLVGIAAYFRPHVESVVSSVGRKLEALRPSARGFIVEQESDEEEFRRNRIEENQKLGKDTKISELQ